MAGTGPVNVLLIGTGEYTTGYTSAGGVTSDKKAGVAALAFFHLRSVGAVGRIAMAGTNGTKFPAIRTHLGALVGERYGLDTAFDSYPADDVACDREAYAAALATMAPGDVAVIFTPDATHKDIALAAIAAGLHTLVAKPIVHTLADHLELAAAAADAGVLAAGEFHKRWDPLYADARARMADMGEFSFFTSYMSQPKSQLSTFAAWAADSDISYYLNAHHIDFHVWALPAPARPASVLAAAATGVATSLDPPIATEDTITLTVVWDILSGGTATAVYTASWIAPPSDVHSQQRFFYMGRSGQINIDQAHRGYTLATDADGHAAANPLFMRYAPDARGRFAGTHCYGYRSFAAFAQAAAEWNAAGGPPPDLDPQIATLATTVVTTAILEAGRRSLDAPGGPALVAFTYDAPDATVPSGFA